MTFCNRAYRFAGAITLTYVGVQTFQDIVYRILPEPSDAASTLLLGPHPLNIWRAALLLLSFFGLAFVNITICLTNFARRPLAMAMALFGMLFFAILEISLRSVELFWVFLKLPAAYALAPDPAILDKVATFTSVQTALYFPLMLGPLIAGILLATTFNPPGRRWNGLIRFAFGLNSLRTCMRLSSMFLHVSAFDFLSGPLYLPIVFVVQVPIAVWLLQPSVDIPGQPR